MRHLQRLARYGSGMMPVGYETKAITSPVFNYPYTRTREALETMRKANEWDPCHGLKLRKIIHKDRLDIHPTTDSFHGRRVVLMLQRARISDCSDTRQSSGRVPRLEMWKQ